MDDKGATLSCRLARMVMGNTGRGGLEVVESLLLVVVPMLAVVAWFVWSVELLWSLEG